MPMTSDALQTVARRSRGKGQDGLDIRMAETLPDEEEDEDEIDDEEIDEEDMAEEEDEEDEEEEA
jgi:hypothetical protein